MFNDFYMGWTECSVLYARASCRTRLFLSLVFRGAVSVSPQAGLDRKGMLVLDGGPQLQLSSTVLSRSPSCKVKHSLCFCLHPTYLCNEIRVIADWWMSGGLRRGGGGEKKTTRPNWGHILIVAVSSEKQNRHFHVPAWWQADFQLIPRHQHTTAIPLGWCNPSITLTPRAGSRRGQQLNVMMPVRLVTRPAK